MARSTHGTLAAGVVTTVTITPGEEGIVIVNRDLTGTIWARIDGQAPAVEADGSYVIIGAREFPMSRTQVGLGAVTVKLLSDAVRKFSVEAVQ